MGNRVDCVTGLGADQFGAKLKTTLCNLATCAPPIVSREMHFRVRIVS